MFLEHANNGPPTEIHYDPNRNNMVVVDAVCDPDTGTYTITPYIGFEDENGSAGSEPAGEETNVVSVSCD